MALKKLLSNLEEGKSLSDVSQDYSFQNNYNYGSSTSIFNSGFDFQQKTFAFGTQNFYDRPRQGFSREPFINKKNRIPDLDKGPSRFLGFIDSLTDGAIRGGLSTAIEHSAKDVARISKFFLSQRGIGFLTTQVGLQLMNPKIEEGGKGALRAITELTGGENRTYNLGINTLAQVASNFSGVHFDRAGVLPIRDDRTKYATTVANIKTEKNRLVELRENHLINPESVDPFSRTGLAKTLGLSGTGFGNFLDKAVNTGKVIVDKAKGLLGITNNILYDYSSGPSSILGIGRTTIRKYQDSKIPANFREDLNGGLDKTHTLTLNPLVIDQVFQTPDSLSGTDRNYIPISSEKFARPEDSYRENNHRIRAGNPGTITNDFGAKISDQRVDSFIYKTIDKINYLDIFNNGTVPLENTRDFIKFYFNIISPGKNVRLAFRAFLDDYSDNYTGNWSEFNYAGRGEPFYTYNKFKRTVNFSFKVAAQTRHELKPIYRKLNYLISSTAPTYGENGRMRGTFVKATIGDLLRGNGDGVPGFFSNIAISWQKNYPWEIAMDNPEGGSDKIMYELPHVLDVKCSFTPIHDFIPQTGTTSTFIMPNNSRWKGPAANSEAKALPKSPEGFNFNGLDPLTANILDTSDIDQPMGPQNQFDNFPDNNFDFSPSQNY